MTAASPGLLDGDRCDPPRDASFPWLVDMQTRIERVPRAAHTLDPGSVQIDAHYLTQAGSAAEEVAEVRDV